MSLTTISWVRNEADIIEIFVRHHAAFAERMIIIVHRSEDNTREILEELKREGIPLDIRTDERIAHEQGEALSQLMLELAEEEPEAWILPLDADEFLGSMSSSPKELIHTLPHTPHLFPWRTYVPTPEDPMEELHVLRRIAHRRKNEIIPYSKVFFPASVGKTARLPLGSHQLLDRVTSEPIQMKDTEKLFLAHFPIRSENQLRTKIIGGWLSHLANAKRKSGEIYQWENLFERAKDPRPITQEELHVIALRYALFPESLSPELIKDPLPTAATAMKYPVHMLDPGTLLSGRQNDRLKPAVVA
ncbi:hypothetical protein A3D88_00180 [Candidatus Peribacteria bacterium RIFCSPHIGHO2_02_FULL_52_16]|nr:MAG: hypothetical protein A2706_01160 [Candidatus Peribacteria bacterium RIFCSPHIGHO2_01_FULL_51_35]OGJ61541.1 MAG: hypothetical protein A3D88_00180 [Candidatus Peribacteria bacterium RIFCSPHIGHO2_02_FULL_52_16]